MKPTLTKSIGHAALCLAITSTIAACAPQYRQPTAAEQAQVQEVINAMKLRAANYHQQQLQSQVQAPQAVKKISGTELTASVSSIKNAGHAASIEIRNRQLFVDETPYLDPAGQIVKFKGEVTTGEFVYMLKNMQGHYVLKYNRAGSNQPGFELATAVSGPSGITVTTSTGQTLQGSSLLPLSDGFLVSRDNAVFIYTLDDQVKTFPVREGFHVTPFQNGDVSGTGYVLLERDKEQATSSGFMGSLKGLGATLGINKAYDYVLANIETGQEVPLNLPSGLKEVNVHSGCVKQNNFVNKCSNMESFESLYQPNGQPNYDHYFWAVDWFKGGNGPLAVYQESTKIRAIELDKSQIHTVFSRTLGVNHFSVSRSTAGVATVSARLGFSTDEVADLDTFISQNTGELISFEE